MQAGDPVNHPDEGWFYVEFERGMPRHGDDRQETLAAGVGLAFESRERGGAGLFGERQHKTTFGGGLRFLRWTAELCAFVFEDRNRVDERDQFLHEGGIG